MGGKNKTCWKCILVHDSFLQKKSVLTFPGNDYGVDMMSLFFSGLAVAYFDDLFSPQTPICIALPWIPPRGFSSLNMSFP